MAANVTRYMQYIDACHSLPGLQVSGLNKVNEEMTATVDFTNPFSFILEHVYIRLEGPGVLSPVSKYYG